MPEAKAHVAEKLGVSPADLSDPVVMHEIREKLGGLDAGGKIGDLGSDMAVDPDNLQVWQLSSLVELGDRHGRVELGQPLGHRMSGV